jgi:glutamyl-tRNA reductase
VSPAISESPMGVRGVSAGARPAADATVQSLALVGIEMSLATVPLSTLEAAAREITTASTSAWFEQFTGTQELALISTCHRIELVLLLRSQDDLGPWTRVIPGPAEGWVVRHGAGVVDHLVRVAAGRESLAVGESEAASQVRRAGHAVATRYPRPILRELLTEIADDVGPLTTKTASVAANAVARLLELSHGRPARVLIVGCGTVGRRVVEELLPFGADMTVLYHARPPDDAFVRRSGVRCVPWSGLAEELAKADIVVTATKVGTRALDPDQLPKDRSLLLADLGLPRNIDPAVRNLPNVRLVDLEDLFAVGRERRKDLAPPPSLREVAQRHSERVEEQLREPWTDALRRSIEASRRAELAVAGPFLGPLTAEQERAVEHLTRRLVDRVLLPLTVCVGSLPPSPEGDRVRQTLVEFVRTHATDGC